MLKILNEYSQYNRPDYGDFTLHFKYPETILLWENFFTDFEDYIEVRGSSALRTVQFWTTAKTVADGKNEITQKAENGEEVVVTQLPRYVNVFSNSFYYDTDNDDLDRLWVRMVAEIVANKLGLNYHTIVWFMGDKMPEELDTTDQETFDDLKPSVYVDKRVKAMYDKFKTSAGIAKAILKTGVNKDTVQKCIEDAWATMKSTRKYKNKAPKV